MPAPKRRPTPSPPPFDLKPHGLVAALVAESDGGLESATLMSTEELSPDVQDALAKLPELVMFAGYVAGVLTDQARPNESGADSTPTQWLLLYLDAKLLTWLVVEKTGVVYRDSYDAAEDGPATRERRDVIWVKRDALVSRGSGPQTIQGRFLSGDFTRAGDFTPTLAGGTFPAGMGILSEAYTPSCCTKRSYG